MLKSYFVARIGKTGTHNDFARRVINHVVEAVEENPRQVWFQSQLTAGARHMLRQHHLQNDAEEFFTRLVNNCRMYGLEEVSQLFEFATAVTLSGRCPRCTEENIPAHVVRISPAEPRYYLLSNSHVEDSAPEAIEANLKSQWSKMQICADHREARFAASSNTSLLFRQEPPQIFVVGFGHTYAKHPTLGTLDNQGILHVRMTNPEVVPPNGLLSMTRFANTTVLECWVHCSLSTHSIRSLRGSALHRLPSS